TRMRKSVSPASSSGLSIASKRNLSQASEALDTSSRRKISLLLYKEWIIRCSSCLTSAWKPRVSDVVSVWLMVLVIQWFVITIRGVRAPQARAIRPTIWGRSRRLSRCGRSGRRRQRRQRLTVDSGRLPVGGGPLPLRDVDSRRRTSELGAMAADDGGDLEQ